MHSALEAELITAVTIKHSVTTVSVD